jgi:plasmid stabilization system protein ParE
VKHYQVIILPSAERDIGEAYEWLAEQDAEAAIRWYSTQAAAQSSVA